MWARGVSGNEILGLYGGDPRNPTGNVTRSWGGIDMEENDVVIGRAAQAAVHWDDSAGTLQIGRPSASNLLLSGGAAQMRDSSTVWGSWSNNGVVIGRVANSTSRVEITNAGAINLINRNGSGTDTTAISLAANGSASFSGSVTSTSGTIGGWTIGSSALTGTNISLSSGGEFSIGASNAVVKMSGSDPEYLFWAGHADYTSAPVRISATGELRAFKAAAIRLTDDPGGAPSTTTLSSVANTASNSTGAGTIKMKGSTSRDSAGFIKIYIGTTEYWVPVFSAITG